MIKQVHEDLRIMRVVTDRKHDRDLRRYVYSLDEFATAATHDPLWNAAQTQLIREGRIHNYLRMLWARRFSNGLRHRATRLM